MAELNTVLQNAVPKLRIFVDIQFVRNNAIVCSKVPHLLKLVKKTINDYFKRDTTTLCSVWPCFNVASSMGENGPFILFSASE